MHDLEFVNGEASMAYVGETPWHGLGKKVPNDISPEQMLVTAGLDWQVVKKPLFYQDSEGKTKATNKVAIVRDTDDKLMTVVSKEWNPVQNLEAFKFFDDFVKGGDMEMHTAGSLRDGKMVWAMAQIKDSFELFGGDKVDGYLLFSNPHEFGRSIDIRFTPIRVVCNNTLSFALEQEANHFVKLSHRQEFKPDDIKSTLGIAKDKLAMYKEAAQFLGSKRFKKESILEYFNRVFPSMSYDEEKRKLIVEGLYKKEAVSRQAKEAMETLHTQPGAEFAEGSWWQAFNTVTYLTDHTLGRSKSARLNSAWYGTNYKRKQQALQLATEYAEVA
tara:strand:+ start:5076 stop:6065 length:990 start_codon:yes stop_codon:yes gene_type:complete